MSMYTFTGRDWVEEQADPTTITIDQRRKKQRKKKMSTAQKANLALKKVNKIYRETEFKEYQYLQNASVDYSGTVATLFTNGPNQGDTYNSRDGTKIFVTSIDIRGQVITGGLDAIIRVIILNDFNNTISAVNDYIESAYVSSVSATLAFREHQEKALAKCLYDKTFSINEGDPWRLFSKKIPINKTCIFNEGTGTQTCIKNNIKVLVVSNLVSANLPSYGIMYKINFVDL